MRTRRRMANSSREESLCGRFALSANNFSVDLNCEERVNRLHQGRSETRNCSPVEAYVRGNLTSFIYLGSMIKALDLHYLYDHGAYDDSKE